MCGTQWHAQAESGHLQVRDIDASDADHIQHGKGAVTGYVPLRETFSTLRGKGVMKHDWLFPGRSTRRADKPVTRRCMDACGRRPDGRE